MKGTVELKLELISLSEQITCLRAEFVAPVWVLGACGLFVCLVSSVAAVTSAAQGEGGGGLSQNIRLSWWFGTSVLLR